ncbi:porin [Euhalothece natronophila Z-M001]|uniref:Porin n=1 Tax=Euhalothece natronophila Z-M001 TaxID=522448 RepID=A0A5B8NKK7_9CHRO|nr:iron uptake porin [Euhalothece natronophila]QDZ38639.1 porin [Euhalothece natronophila Z-M001]
MRYYYLFWITLNVTLLTILSSAQAQADSSIPSPVTPVVELEDIHPTDWAFNSLQQLHERYQCLQGYPDQTFRGEQPITRYEFAALLNRCLSQLEETPTAEEEAMIERLETEFIRELAVMRGRVDAATARVRELEVTQFSPHTQLRGVVNLVLTNSSQAGENQETVLQGRTRLNFESSFTGRDRLLTRLTAGNSITPDLASGSGEFTQTHQWRGNSDNDFFLDKLTYRFPLSDQTLAMISITGGEHRDYQMAANPFFEDGNAGTTTLSTFAQRNPILNLGGGTGIAFSQEITPSVSFGAGYYTPEANDPEKALFNSSYSTGVGLTWDARENLAFSFNYLHSYFEQGDFGFNDGLDLTSPVVGTAIANETLRQFPIVSNAYGLELFWQPQEKFGIGGQVGYTDIKALDHGDGEIWNYSLSLVFPDLGQENNLGGIIIGAQPYLGNFIAQNFPKATPWHLEGFYQWQVTDNVSLTPGLIWNINPNQDETEADVITSVMRMTISF